MLGARDDCNVLKELHLLRFTNLVEKIENEIQRLKRTELPTKYSWYLDNRV